MAVASAPWIKEPNMSTAKSLLCQSVEMAHFITRSYVEDLTDAQLMLRSVPGTNHIAWQLGHMIGSVRGMLAGLGREAGTARRVRGGLYAARRRPRTTRPSLPPRLSI